MEILKKIAFWVCFAAALFFLSVGGYRLARQNSDLQKEVSSLEADVSSLKKENEKTKDEIKYFSFPENLLKELRSRFNYIKRGEKMIIVIPSEE